jgi:hypothetical protein
MYFFIGMCKSKNKGFSAFSGDKLGIRSLMDFLAFVGVFDGVSGALDCLAEIV